MNILIVNTNIGYGGASKILSFVADVLGDSGNNVLYLTFRSDVILQPISKSVKYRHIRTEEKNSGILGSIRTIIYIHNLLKRENFDIAIAFLPPSQLRLALASKFTNTKIIFSHRGDPFLNLDDLGLKYRVIRWINDIIFKMADYFVFQTDMAKSYYSKKIQLRSSIIANPIHPLVRSEERNIESIKKRIVTLGRYEIKQKRQDILIEAFNKFNILHPEYVLEIYGDGEDRGKILEMAKSNPNIKLCRVTKRVSEKLQNAAMFVLTSDYEGIPNALLEAMSLGVPCISTDCSPGGASMLIDSKEKGIIVNCGDVNALANAMSFMAEHPDIAEEMGKKGMSVNVDYSPTVIANKWIEIVKQIF